MRNTLNRIVYWIIFPSHGFRSAPLVTRELNSVEQIRNPWLGMMILIKQPKIIACLCDLFKSPSTVWSHCEKCQTVYTINWYFTWCFVPEHKIMEQYKGELYVTENILILWKILPINNMQICLFQQFTLSICVFVKKSTEQGQKYYRN